MVILHNVTSFRLKTNEKEKSRKTWTQNDNNDNKAERPRLLSQI